MRGFLTKTSTFVSIDVVNSTLMKVNSPEEDSIFSFLSYQKFIEKVVLGRRGRIVSITGDGIMAQFASSQDGVEASVGVIEGLDRFNQNTNLLKAPFRLRIGVNTGKIYQDNEEDEASRQIMPSPAIDAAGYLQKNAPANSVWLAQSTVERMEKPMLGLKKLHFDDKINFIIYSYSMDAGQTRKGPASTRKIRVLIIEDEPDQAFMIEEALATSGHESFIAFDGSEGLLGLKVFKPDIVLLDIGLPRIGGWQVLHEIKANKAAPYIPVLMMARRYKIEDVEKSFEMGASGCVMKPCDLSALMLKIKILSA
ncbi:MAG: response regulator [Elusimicrobiota bacterium]